MIGQEHQVPVHDDTVEDERQFAEITKHPNAEDILVPFNRGKHSEGKAAVSISFLKGAELSITPEGMLVRIENLVKFAARFSAAFPSPSDLTDFLGRLLESAGIDFSQLDPASLGIKLWMEIKRYLDRKA